MRLFITILFLTTALIVKTSAYSREQADSILSRRGEVVISFDVSDPLQIQAFTHEMSITKVTGKAIVAYLNKQQFSNFLEKNIPYTLHFPTKTLSSKQKSTHNPWNWDSYPTYKQYLSMMDSFARAYPAICKLEEIGQSVNGRKILALKISDSAAVEQNKKEFLYTSTIHGNETTGFILLLRLIDYILRNYNTNPDIQDLVNNLQIYINPVSNPDGLFRVKDSVTYESTRNNAQGIDLNRNFPDPVDGNHPDENIYATENLAMMAFLEKHHFALSANLHDGAEVVNYPWDTYSSDSLSQFNINNASPDSAFFIKISKQYADTAQFYGTNSYFRSFNNTGYIQGNRWYVITGGRQDYVTHFLEGKEVTIELRNEVSYVVNITPESMLNNLWEYNYRSLLNFIKATHSAPVMNKNTGINRHTLANGNIRLINKRTYLEVHCKTPTQETFIVDFISASGQIAYSTKILLEGSTSLSVPENLKGLYLIRLRNLHTQYTQKVLF